MTAPRAEAGDSSAVTSVGRPDTPVGTVALAVMAAGMGSRLGSAWGDRAKWMLPVDGRPIADHHRAAVQDCTAIVDRVVVVTGHAADGILAYLAASSWTVPVTAVYNDRYDVRNNWLSLALALEHLVAAGWTGPVVVANSDFVAGDDLMVRFLAAAAKADYDALLAVDDVRPITDEAMKVSGSPAPDGGLLVERVGKVGVPSPAGEYVGLAALRGPGISAMLELLNAHEADAARHDLWYDLSFADLAAAGYDVRGWLTGPCAWVEIDDARDLTAAQLLHEKAAS